MSYQRSSCLARPAGNFSSTGLAHTAEHSDPCLNSARGGHNALNAWFPRSVLKLNMVESTEEKVRLLEVSRHWIVRQLSYLWALILFEP